MSQLLIAHIGSYPRIGEQKDQQRHRRARAHFLNKEISAHAMRDVEQSLVQEVVREQLDAGLDEVTDGLISWEDPISHLCCRVGGVELTGLRRYFDGNFYFRVPCFVGKPRVREAVVAPEFAYAQSVSNRTVRAILTGPITLARHTSSQRRELASLASRVAFFSELLSDEVAALLRVGAKRIQFSEPALTWFPDDIKTFRKDLSRLLERTRPATSILALTRGAVTPVLRAMPALPETELQLDLTHDRTAALDWLAAKRPTTAVGLGLVDAVSTRVDAVPEISVLLREWSARAQPERIYLTPSDGLEELPRDVAQSKLAALAAIRIESGLLAPAASHAA